LTHPSHETPTASYSNGVRALWNWVWAELSVPYDFSNEPWRYDCDRFVGAVALAPDRAVVLAQGSPTAHALHSGNTVWPPIAP
jgi:hypothetical protein